MINNFTILGLLTFFIGNQAFCQPGLGGPLNVGHNFRIHPGQVSQTEVFIVQSPLDKNLLFSSCNTLNFIPFFVSEGVFSSVDGGLSWQGNDTCTGDPIEFHGGDPGITIDKNGTFILTRLGRPPFNGLYSHYSTDNGQTWSTQRTVSTDDLERATLATDALSPDLYYGRTYAVWIKFANPFPLMFSFTDDGSGSWSVPVPVNNPSRRSAGGDIVVGRGGVLYTTWAGVTEVSPFKEILVGFAVSNNGGQNWNVTEDAFPVNGINGILPGKANIRVNGLPCIDTDTTNGPHSGWIYILTGQKDLAPAGNDPDIILNRSTDGGSTWSPGIRVNQDPLNNGKTQYFPSVHVDKFGAVNVIFYDDRNTTNDSSGVFLARSVDGGDTWKEYEISDHNFKPVPIGGLGQGYQGDNIDLTSTDKKVIPVWMDNSTGIYQIWTVPVDFSVFYGTGENNAQPDNMLGPVYPNPSGEIVQCELQVRKEGHITLEIFDISGMRVGIILDKKKLPGTYKIVFNLDNIGKGNLLTNGIYFLRLTADDVSEIRRIVLLR